MKVDYASLQLLFVHLEPDLVETSTTETPRRICAAAAALSRAAQAVGVPVTYVVTKGDSSSLVDELRPFAREDNCFEAHAPSAFASPPLAGVLEAHRRRTLIIAAFAAEVALLHTALDAIRAGYQVLVPVDVTGSLSVRTEAAALRQIDRAGGEITTTASVIAGLLPNFAGELGEKMLAEIDEVQAS